MAPPLIYPTGSEANMSLRSFGSEVGGMLLFIALWGIDLCPIEYLILAFVSQWLTTAVWAKLQEAWRGPVRSHRGKFQAIHMFGLQIWSDRRGHASVAKWRWRLAIARVLRLRRLCLLSQRDRYPRQPKRSPVPKQTKKSTGLKAPFSPLTIASSPGGPGFSLGSSGVFSGVWQANTPQRHA